MAYVIVVNDDNSLYGSNKEKIMQREKLFNKVWFLAAPYYKGYDMSQCTVTIRYLLPISREFKTETLVLSEETYEEYLKYTLPIDTCITKEHGNIELNLTFTMLDSDDDGNIIQRVRKTASHFLKVTPIPDWDSIVPDSALSALDQRILKQDAQIKALEEYAIAIGEGQVDNLSYNDKENTLQLLAGENAVGDRVKLKTSTGSADEDGVPVIDLSDFQFSEVDPDNPEEGFSDIVEF